ncbi:Cell cycle serine/threonine-protein kinase cdc5/MSD2 [Taxawa tesnikishii (nom. ined.)]|nr:Cell cycle serine/threonine-protein kinase cdc5/MSD2 [Dothideales sp. JES 119]
MSVHAEPPPAIVTEPHGIKYATGNQLGKGGFAICHKAEMLEKDKPTGHTVALKIVKTKMEPAKLAQKFITELQIHSKLAHPNIVAFHRAFSFEANTYVVLELCSCGSLADLLKRRKCLTMPEIRRFIIQVSGAVKYLHTRNIVHRDLKTGNLFLDENMNIKVGDFGLAALLVSGKDMDAKRRTTMCGTPNYLAPEILEKGKGHSEKVDLWAIGIIAYTLAVGKAPFHASSKEEIYKKLKAGEYSWPDLSTTSNEISADLRDLVASLLVDEELRPCPDQIVSHPFFKIAFIPYQMSRTQLQKAPTWSVPLPGPEVLQRGYSESWFSVCKESGVGEYSPGKCFQLNAGKRIRSIVKEIEKEIAAGRQPVIPIPSDTVYTPFPASNGGLTEIVEERESSSEGRQLQEISHNERQLVVPKTRENATLTESRRKDAELMPPPTLPRRQGTVRGTVRRPRLASQERQENAENIPETEQQQEYSKQPSSLSQPTASTQSTLRARQAATSKEKVVEEAPEDVFQYRRAADASLARRPRTMRKRTAETEGTQPVTVEEKPQVEKPSTKSVLPVRLSRTRAKQAEPEVIEILEDEDAESNQPLVLPPVPVMSAKPKTAGKSVCGVWHRPGIGPGAPVHVPGQSCFGPGEEKASSVSKCAESPSRPLPFVSKWVDYSRKYGVGYVLDNGTVGCILNSFATRRSQAIHVVVRHGERWLKRIGKKFEDVEDVPFEIFEDRAREGIHRLRGPSTDEQAERQHTLKVLWVKFARYMQKSGGANTTETEVDEEKGTREDLLFVRCYQRMGNVGIWGFSDGCLQVRDTPKPPLPLRRKKQKKKKKKKEKKTASNNNLQLHFPDHTKFVFSADGLHASATLVSVEGVATIAANNDLPMKMLRDREILTFPVHTLLYGSRSSAAQASFGEVVRANMFEEKLQFLQQILEQWLGGGGVGCQGDVEHRLQWNGLWVNEHARKIDWITVGRYGGDEARA